MLRRLRPPDWKESCWNGGNNNNSSNSSMRTINKGKVRHHRMDLLTLEDTTNTDLEGVITTISILDSVGWVEGGRPVDTTAVAHRDKG